MRALVAIVLASCAGSEATPCNDGTFCPAGTLCGLGNTCLVEPGRCESFVEHSPCLLDGPSHGHCEGDTCVAGTELLGFAITVPGDIGAVDAIAHMVDHPEILPAKANINGFFELIAPPGAEGVIEIEFEDTIPARTRIVRAEPAYESLDVLYGGIPMIGREQAQLLVDPVGLTIDPQLGAFSGVVVDTEGNPRIGVSAMLITGSCDGPFYANGSGEVVVGATGTATPGVFLFVNCAPGIVEAKVDDGTTASCHVLEEFAALSFEVPIAADRATFVGRVLCD